MFASSGQMKIKQLQRSSRFNDPIDHSGFLLLETLFAVLILTVGLTLVVRSFGSSINALRVTADYTKAMLLLEEKMWDLESKGSISPGISFGVFESYDAKFQWEVNAIAVSKYDLCEVTVAVLWKNKGKRRDLSLVTYLKRQTDS